MKLLVFLLLLGVIIQTCCQVSYQEKEIGFKDKLFIPINHNTYREDTYAPTVFVAIFVRNKEHALPYFLNTLYNVNYPKQRMIIK